MAWPDIWDMHPLERFAYFYCMAELENNVVDWNTIPPTIKQKDQKTIPPGVRRLRGVRQHMD